MKTKNTIRSISSLSTYCQQCKGKHWDSDSKQQTQENAKAEFGVIPNNCVNDSNGKIHCPAALGLL